MALQFALNHMTVARQSYTDAFDLAAMLGCIGVEFRNDLPSELFDGDAPDMVKAKAKAAGLRILGLSEVKMFNAWDDRKASETEALLTIAKAIGAETISLIPRCDGHGCGNGERQANLRLALREILPMLKSFDIVGLVEALGFEHSSLRFKSEAMEAIVALGGEERLKLVHDTFHHYLASETQFFPDDTGIVHVSGVEDHDLTLQEIGDEHRVLVGPKDRLGNVNQLKELIGAGFDGPISYEAFSPIVHDFAQPKDELQASMKHLESAVSVEETLLPG
ncbi:TIM barrel protein [Roseibium sp. SCPC15]|uniref:TIM barrel protein n=1 Tax=Roseibium sp. SCP15 TaxID=3141376 RepID=UPI003335E57A